MRVDVDISETSGGEGLYEKYGPQRGVPAWTIMDADRKVLADSMREKKNVGFPYEPDEVVHFFDALKKSRPTLADDELRTLKDRLDEHCKAVRAEIEARKKKSEKK